MMLLAMAASTTGVGCATHTLSAQDLSRVDAALVVARRAYPELAGRTIAVRPLGDDGAFFQANFTIASALRPGPLDYEVQANPRAFAAGLPEEALVGVLGHELAHLLDYERRSGGGLAKSRLWPLLPLAAAPHANTWERFTDLVAVDRGFGPGLALYRSWQARTLPAAVVRQKREIYYGAQELGWLIEAHARCPASFKALLDAPPREVRALATTCRCR